jgi:hypothetical protein
LKGIQVVKEYRRLDEELLPGVFLTQPAASERRGEAWFESAEWIEIR